MVFKILSFASILLTSHVLVWAQDSSDQSTEEAVWTPGRITQVTLAIVESALLTLLLIYPGIMDPIVNFINLNIGSAGSRKRRNTRAAMLEQAATIHNLFLDAIEHYEGLDEMLSSL
ncbi:uncharacterized protein LOC125047273 [Penaeus chinensis]|uniref:uncharacterized protein LOC125047273 n=1 Tax=Penaeus chinensis TaxID=139456 RepID=UPI001FB72EFD|nr:uncharacterized protein LOC125047273 [Penaeus chinensis]